MQKRIAGLLLVVATCFLMVACNAEDKAPATKIGVINEEKIYMESEAAKAAVKHLDGVSGKLQPELAAMQAELEKKPNDQALQEEMNRRFFDMQQQFGAEQQQVTNKVNELYKAAREKCRKDAGMAVILSGEMLLDYDPAIDITNQVIAEMNKTAADFSALQPEAPSTNGTAVPAANATAPAAVMNGTVPATNGTAVPAANATSK